MTDACTFEDIKFYRIILYFRFILLSTSYETGWKECLQNVEWDVY